MLLIETSVPWLEREVDRRLAPCRSGTLGGNSGRECPRDGVGCGGAGASSNGGGGITGVSGVGGLSIGRVHIMCSCPSCDTAVSA